MVRVRFNVQIKYSNSMIFKNSLSASCPVSLGRLKYRGLRKKVNHLLNKSSENLPVRVDLYRKINKMKIKCR